MKIYEVAEQSVSTFINYQDIVAHDKHDAVKRYNMKNHCQGYGGVVIRCKGVYKSMAQQAADNAITKKPFPTHMPEVEYQVPYSGISLAQLEAMADETRKSGFLKGLYFKRTAWRGDLCCHFDKRSKRFKYIKYIKTDAYVGNDTKCNNDYVQCDSKGNQLVKPIKGNKMNKQTNDVNYIGGEYTVVAVSYDLGTLNLSGTYNFKLEKGLTVEPGDTLVVESLNGLGLVKVIKEFANSVENAEEISKATAWVVSKVDTTTQDARKDATIKRGYIIKQLEERKKAVESVNMYALLAASDPESAKLLEELKGIEGLTIEADKDV